MVAEVLAENEVIVGLADEPADGGDQARPGVAKDLLFGAGEARVAAHRVVPDNDYGL